MIAVVLTIYTGVRRHELRGAESTISRASSVAASAFWAAILARQRAGGFTATHEALCGHGPGSSSDGKATANPIITWSILMVGGSITSVVRFLIPKI